MKEVEQVASRELAVAQNLGQQARADGFSGVRCDDCRPAVCVPEEVVAAPDPDDKEAQAFQCSDELPARENGKFGHAETDTR